MIKYFSGVDSEKIPAPVVIEPKDGKLFDKLKPLIDQATGRIDSIKTDIDRLKQSQEEISSVRENLVQKQKT